MLSNHKNAAINTKEFNKLNSIVKLIYAYYSTILSGIKLLKDEEMLFNMEWIFNCYSRDMVSPIQLTGLCSSRLGFQYSRLDVVKFFLKSPN